MLNSSILSIDKVLSSTTTSFRVDLGAMAMKGVLHFPQSQAMGLHHQIVCVVKDIRLVGGGLTSQQKFSRSFLQLQPTGLRDKGVRTFFKGINLKVIVIARLELELTYYDIVLQHVSHYATGISPPKKHPCLCHLSIR